jgi:hypothetical protein
MEGKHARPTFSKFTFAQVYAGPLLIDKNGEAPYYKAVFCDPSGSTQVRTQA